MEDMADLYGAGRVDPFQALQVRTVILRAERGILDQPMGLYPAGYLQAVAAQQPLAQVREVEDVNHYTILLGDRGALQVAEALRDIVDDVS
jgi:lipase